MVEQQEQQWHLLRQDIRLLNDAYVWFGKASYQILDPANNSFYKLGAIEFEILKYWDLASPERIVKEVNQQSHYHISTGDVEAVGEFLSDKGLLLISGNEKAEVLSKRKQQSRKGWFGRLSKKYLFLRIPLLKPDKQITTFHRAIKPFLSKRLLWISFLLVALGAIGVIREWEYFSDYFSLLLTPKGAFYALIALIVSKVIHEVAHATAVKHFGCKVYHMGIALVVLFPMLWTDASDSWRLKENSKRMWINGIGIIAELLLAGIASLLWVLLPEGELKLIMFVLSGVTWLGTLLINLNPFMKFDGYYLLSDLVQTPNLQSRAIATSLDLIREKLWGWRQPPKESLSSSQYRWFIFYGMGCLIYRLFLYVSIALIVYHLMPPPFGLILAGIEIYWFLLYPLYKELSLVWSQKGQWWGSRCAKISLFVLALSIILLFLPTSRNIDGVAVWRSQDEIALSVAKPVMLLKINVQNYKTVKQGEVLFEVYSPKLKKEEEQLRATAERLENEYQHYLVSQDPKQRNNAFYIKEELNSTLSSQNNNQQQQASLQVLSPLNGVLRDIPDHIRVGDWLEKKEFLGYITNERSKIEAFVSEFDVGRLAVGDGAMFYPKHFDVAPIALKITSIAQTNARSMPFAELTVNYGGDVEIEGESGEERIKQSLFKVTLSPVEEREIQQFLVGDVVIKGSYQSPLTYMAAKTYALLLRELSF